MVAAVVSTCIRAAMTHPIGMGNKFSVRFSCCLRASIDSRYLSMWILGFRLAALAGQNSGLVLRNNGSTEWCRHKQIRGKCCNLVIHSELRCRFGKAPFALLQRRCALQTGVSKRVSIQWPQDIFDAISRAPSARAIPGVLCARGQSEEEQGLHTNSVGHGRSTLSCAL